MELGLLGSSMLANAVDSHHRHEDNEALEQSGAYSAFPKTEDPVWIMGKCFSAIRDHEELLAFIRSRLWVSYRSNFPPIGNSGLTSDKGWGCMLRCGQMVVAEALLRDFRWSSECRDEEYMSIVQLFEDSTDSVYGIHQIALLGESSDGKLVGTWFGPNTIAHVLRKLSYHDLVNNLAMHVAMDNTVIIDEIKAAAWKTTDKTNSRKTWHPLILFIPLRLGLTEINPLYLSDLKECLEMPQLTGILGGRPNHALFFIGYVGEELIYLDPHFTQPYGKIGNKTIEAEVELDSSYHTDTPGRLSFESLDPSLALTFFCQTEEEFDDLMERLHRRLILFHNSPLFELRRERPLDMAQQAQHIAPARAVSSSPGQQNAEEEDDLDDFEII